MTLEFKLLCAVFLIFLTNNAFKLHDSNAFIDEGAREGDFGIQSDPLNMEKGIGLHASTGNKEIIRRWTDRMLIDEPRPKRSRKEAQIRVKRSVNKRIKKALVKPKLKLKTARKAVAYKPNERRLAETVSKSHSGGKGIKIKKNSIDIQPKSFIVKKKASPARKLFDRLKTHTKKQLPIRKLIAPRQNKPVRHFKISESASFLRMKHDREQRFREMNIKVVPPTSSLTPRQRLLKQSKKLVHQAKKAKKLKTDTSSAEKKTQAKSAKKKETSVKKEVVSAPADTTLTAKLNAPTEEQTAQVLNQAKQVAQVLSQVVSTPAGQPLAQILSPAISTPTIQHFGSDERTLDDEEKRAQNFVNDLQTQVRQTKMAVEGIQDKLIVIKENEGEIKAMLSRLLRDRNMIV